MRKRPVDLIQGALFRHCELYAILRPLLKEETAATE